MALCGNKFLIIAKRLVRSKVRWFDQTGRGGEGFRKTTGGRTSLIQGFGEEIISLQARVGAVIKTVSSKGSQRVPKEFPKVSQRVPRVAGGALTSPTAALESLLGQLGLIFTPEWFFDVIQFFRHVTLTAEGARSLKCISKCETSLHFFHLSGCTLQYHHHQTIEVA